MKKLAFLSLDDHAEHALKMAELSAKTLQLTAVDEKVNEGVIPVLIATESQSLETAARLARQRQGQRLFLLFPEPSAEKRLPEALYAEHVTLIPVQVDSLAAFAFSHVIKTLELLFLEFSPDDFNLGDENYFASLKGGLFHRFFHVEGRHLKEAVLRMAHRVRSRRIREGVAYVIRVPANTALFALDEALDVLEIAVPPERPIHFAIRFDKESQTAVRISALIATPEHASSDLQSRIDAQPTYMGKLATIVDAYAFREVDEKEMENLCRDNGLEPDDAERFYDLIYGRPEETAELIRALRATPSKAGREELIAQKLAEAFLDVRVLEELAGLFGLSAEAILQRSEVLKKQKSEPFAERLAPR